MTVGGRRHGGRQRRANRSAHSETVPVLCRVGGEVVAGAAVSTSSSSKAYNRRRLPGATCRLLLCRNGLYAVDRLGEGGGQADLLCGLVHGSRATFAMGVCCSARLVSLACAASGGSGGRGVRRRHALAGVRARMRASTARAEGTHLRKSEPRAWHLVARV